jgi:cyclomaltodextrinase
MSEKNPIPLGRYRHYKGNDYSVVGFARHSETQEMMALYVPLYGEGGYWVRPLKMFTENVELDGSLVPRFEYQGD